MAAGEEGAQAWCTHPGGKSAWHMGQLRRVCAWSALGSFWAPGIPQEPVVVRPCDDPVADPWRTPAPWNSRYERPGPLPPTGAGGKGVQEKVSGPTVKTSGDGARSGLRRGSCKTGWSGGVGGAHTQAARGSPHAPGWGKPAAAAARHPPNPHSRFAAARPTTARTRRRPPAAARARGMGAWGGTGWGR